MDRVALSVEEAAALMGVSKPKMYQLVHRTDFPAVKFEGRTLIFYDGLKEWMRTQVEQRGGGV